MCPCLIPLEIYKVTKSNFKHIFVILGLFFAFEEKFCLCFLAFFLWGRFLDSHESYCIGFQDVTVRLALMGSPMDMLGARMAPSQPALLYKMDFMYGKVPG